MNLYKLGAVLTVSAIVCVACATDEDLGAAAKSSVSTLATQLGVSVDPANCITRDMVFDPESASSIERWSSDIFAGRVVSVGGKIGEDDDPRTLVKIEVTKTYKGDRRGEVSVGQQGTTSCLVNGVPLVTVGQTYIFATNGTEQPLIEVWHGTFTPESDKSFQ